METSICRVPAAQSEKKTITETDAKFWQNSSEFAFSHFDSVNGFCRLNEARFKMIRFCDTNVRLCRLAIETKGREGVRVGADVRSEDLHEGCSFDIPSY